MSIKNYALIEDLKVTFTAGLSIITGETGAGKSILLDALSLALGRRADLDGLRNKDQKCVVEASFQIKGYKLKDFFDKNDLEYDEHTILRREILPTGKSRAFINDSPVLLETLGNLGEKLIDVHSQHQTLLLRDVDFQMKIIDVLANNEANLENYVALRRDLKNIEADLEDCKHRFSETQKEYDYKAFVLEELKAAQLSADELNALENEQELLRNAVGINEALQKANDLLSNDSFGIIEQLGDLRKALQEIERFSPEFQNYLKRCESTLIELDDLRLELDRSQETLESDPVRLEWVQQRIDKIYSLFRKHQVDEIDKLLELQQTLEEEVKDTESLTDKLAMLEVRKKEAEELLKTLGSHIRQERERAIPSVTEYLSKEIAPLGMPHARFQLQLLPTEEFLPNGMDKLEFLFSANKGMDFGDLRKVASGGEMSRIMLVVRSLLAQHSALPTLILDEIDMGVSGEIAHRMGQIMMKMGQHMQLFAITHSPQIASKGTSHYKVFKELYNGRTETLLKVLDTEGREKEIAEMLDGKNLSDSALLHAKQLLAER